ncbi:CPXCG motif-containing cysteine-rich protein [Polaribacter sp. 20A6]|uniref:CPXCG motif-containing cysteine-rich protein n=1 Tax=Polaribacter sp. 20A6 TaxID=2687289 RepID=UPI0013FDFF21|nr:CPXCG motif-containing cysteine-rich protein [Polaribacter sp. 20A6]
METEHFFQCPHCWEEISMILDQSVYQQTYIEDCEVCCNPIEITPVFEEGELINFNAQSLEQ